ncbi:MAG: glycosyltransferase 61 family protein [Arenicella sp.]
MIFFPNKYAYNKDDLPFDGGLKQFSNVVIAGERSIIFNRHKGEFFFTKGAKYQVESTMPKCVHHGKTLKERVLCFPGFNHANWYHVVADMGFQMFLAKQRNLVGAVILPECMKLFGPAFLQFFKLFEFKLYFVQHPRKAQKISEVVCFDRFTGRLSDAIEGGVLDEEISQYFSFLEDCFERSSYAKKASKYGEKIFSTRRGKDSRVYENVSEVESEYQSNGYQVVHFGGMNVFEQMAVMKNATHIAGFHGANLTNLIFAHQCTHIEELITRELSGDFKTIAIHRNIQHSRRKLSG